MAKKQVVVENTEVTEDSTAMDTLHPNSEPANSSDSWLGDMTHTEKLAKMIGAFHALRDDDKTDWFKKMLDNANEIGHGRGVGDWSKSNTDSIDAKSSDASKSVGPKSKMDYTGTGHGDKNPEMKGYENTAAAPGATLGVTRSLAKEAVKQDVDAMLTDETLTEEFKSKVSTLFEAAVNARVGIELAAIQDEYNEKLVEEVASHVDDLKECLDAYLDYAAETWISENEVAIQSALRTEITEEFIDGLRNLFAESNIDVPEEKYDVMDALANRVEELELRLSEAIEENADLRGYKVDTTKKEVVEQVSEDLTLVEREKFKMLVEDLDDEGDLEVYASKLHTVKENYFKKNSEKKSMISEALEEVVELDNSNNVVYRDRNVQAVAQAISRTVRK